MQHLTPAHLTLATEPRTGLSYWAERLILKAYSLALKRWSIGAGQFHAVILIHQDWTRSYIREFEG